MYMCMRVCVNGSGESIVIEFVYSQFIVFNISITLLDGNRFEYLITNTNRQT